MSDLKRDSVLNYRPGPDSELPLEPDEPLITIITADRRRYLTDHAAIAAIGAAGVLLFLPLFGKGDQIGVGLLAVLAAVVLRGWWLASEQFARRWLVTDRRLIGPQGRQVMLLEITTLRRLLGDVQIVTRGGQKHLIKHLADSQGVIDAIEAARAAREKLVNP